MPVELFMHYIKFNYVGCVQNTLISLGVYLMCLSVHIRVTFSRKEKLLFKEMLEIIAYYMKYTLMKVHVSS